MSRRSLPSPDMIVLQVTLTFWERDPQVELAVTRGAEVADSGGRRWRVQAASLGIPTSLDLDSVPTLNLPLQVVEGLRANLANEARTLPLWLRFAKPHGYLGLLPWERVLTEVLARPVLRLPDLLERPLENRDVLEVAVCFDAGPETSQEKAGEQIKRLVDTILRVSPRSQTRVNLFARIGWIERLRAMRLDSRIRLHDPSKAPTCSEAIKRAFARRVEGTSAGEQQPTFAGGRLESPWSIWIAQTLETRSLDAIHFVCCSDMTDSGPVLMMSSSPSPNEKVRTLTYTDALELAALMTRTGAWAALFSSPPDHTSATTLALTADALAHTRPASVVCQPLLTSEHATALGAAYAFLFSPRPSSAPSLRDGFIYCQPTSVAAYANLQIPPVLGATELNATVIEKGASLWDRARAYVTRYIPVVPSFELKQPPSWATAVQRYIEMLSLEELRRRSPDVLLSTPESARAQVDPSPRQEKTGEAEETLAEIQKVIRDYLKKSGR
jgi:hypothetical protein